MLWSHISGVTYSYFFPHKSLSITITPFTPLSQISSKTIESGRTFKIPTEDWFIKLSFSETTSLFKVQTTRDHRIVTHDTPEHLFAGNYHVKMNCWKNYKKYVGSIMMDVR